LKVNKENEEDDEGEVDADNADSSTVTSMSTEISVEARTRPKIINICQASYFPLAFLFKRMKGNF